MHFLLALSVSQPHVKRYGPNCSERTMQIREGGIKKRYAGQGGQAAAFER